MTKNLLPRESDLQIAANVADKINDINSDNFILTGSYSIDILTGVEVEHNDIDANIFTDSIQESIGRVALLLDSNSKLLKTLQTDSRLEYSYDHGSRTSEIELQFVEYNDVFEHANGTDFVLSSEESQHTVIVPTVLKAAGFNGSKNEAYEFRVKSLEFAIATWALRISGIALNQKRQVRQTDIDHFAYLIDAQHDIDAVGFSIQHHPQMPLGADANRVLDIALLRVVEGR